MNDPNAPLNTEEKKKAVEEVVQEFKIHRVIKPAGNLEGIKELIERNESLATRGDVLERLVWISTLAQHGSNLEDLCRWAAASKREHEEMMDLQIAREMEEMYGPSTGLFLAIEEADARQVARLLKKKDTDLEETSDRNDGMTPLLLACWMREPKIVASLLAAGANASSSGQHGCSPIHYGAKSLKILTMLLEAGADPNTLSEDDITPLHLAAEKDLYLEQVQLLLERGADLELRDCLGENALDIARKKGAEKIAALLTSWDAE